MPQPSFLSCRHFCEVAHTEPATFLPPVLAKFCHHKMCWWQNLRSLADPPLQCNWEEKVQQTPAFSKVVSIKRLIRHMDNATRKAFAGTAYAETYLWAHDALNQMMDKECQVWMQEKNLLKRWVRPVLGVSDKITVIDPTTGDLLSSCRYKNRPPGDSPELMPCDNSLFRDLMCSLDLCCALTEVQVVAIRQSQKSRYV